MLQKIFEGVQQIAEAIATALETDVTIVDDNLMRVAGTGPYYNKVSERVPNKSAFARALREKKTILIDNPGENSECLDCSQTKTCIETYEICTPIIWQEKPVGVIAIFAYDQKQREIIKSKEKQYINFLRQMAYLIASKVGELRLYEDVVAHNKQLDIIIQNVNQGIILVDQAGEIMHINNKARKLLSLTNSSKELQGELLKTIWPEALIHRAYEDGQEYFDQEEVYSGRGEEKHFLTTGRLIKQMGEITCGVVTFANLEDIQKPIFRYMEKTDDWGFSDIIGVSRQIKESIMRATNVADNESTILILGESGTGKELFARAIHNNSSRKDYPFVAINCSAIPEALLESELFGYESGAFTGAKTEGKIGKFELAKFGTIFLDEIGDMPLYLQAKLLRVLEEKMVTRLGGIKTIEIQARVIAATNQDLEEMIANKMFRKDLYYRLNVIPLNLAPLRERPEDIPVLIDYFIQIYNKRFNKDIIGFTPDALEFLLLYSWPGNVRELENVIEYGINFAVGNYIDIDNIKGRFKSPFPDEADKDLKTLVQEYEQSVILQKLNKYGWTGAGKKKAMEELEISRATLYRKISQE